MPLTDLSAGALVSHEPQRTNNALLYIVGLTAHDAVDDPLVLALESFPVPKRSVGVIEVARLNQKRKYAGNPVNDPMTIVYKDLLTADVAKLINDWFLQVHDTTTGKTGFATAYKRNGYFVQYGPDGTFDRQWNCWGVWPSNFDPGDHDMSGEDMVRINLTLEVDQVTIGERSTTETPATPVAPGTYPAIPVVA